MCPSYNDKKPLIKFLSNVKSACTNYFSYLFAFYWSWKFGRKLVAFNIFLVDNNIDRLYSNKLKLDSDFHYCLCFFDSYGVLSSRDKKSSNRWDCATNNPILHNILISFIFCGEQIQIGISSDKIKLEYEQRFKINY